MSFTTGAKTGLPTNIDLDDATWTTKYLEGNVTLENRISLTAASDPNGAVVGSWYGQPCWNTARGEVWECVRPGPATGDLRSLWIPRSPVPVGGLMYFWRSSVPPGWLPFIGTTYLRVNYPYLYDVLPNGVTKTATDFTLPNISGELMLWRQPNGAEPFYPLVGNLNPDTPIGSADPSYNGATINALLGIKF